MAYQYEVVTNPRPGVQQILIKHELAGSWYNTGTAAAGETLRIVVTPYDNFNLDAPTAYHSDEYDDTVNLTVSAVSGETNTWQFTMPAAKVYVRCEAQSQMSPGAITWPSYNSGFGTAYVYWGATPLQGLQKAIDLNTHSDSYYDFTVSLSTVLADYEQYWPDDIAKLNTGRYYGFYVASKRPTTSNPWACDFTVAYENNMLFPGNVNFDSTYRTIKFLTLTYTVNGALSAHSSHTDTAKRTIGFRRFFDNTRYVYVWNPILTEPGPGEPLYTAVRYILSPENSGEVTGPTELQSYDPFTFTYRIKANYELVTIRAWSVDNTSGEVLIISNYTYNGETRTYTVTVSGLINGSAGVRVLITTIMTNDPSDSGGTNENDGPVGGDGDYDDESDPVPLPAMPAISAADSGFVTLFKPSISQLKDLGNYLWSNLDEFWENLQKIFTNPMDYIIGLNIFPVSPISGTSRDIYIGNWLTNISMPPVQNQFYEFDCGAITIHEHFGSFLDYAPNTHARIMLPFIGDYDLSVNEIMGRTLKLWYRIDLLSGNCLAVLTIDNNTYYQWVGNCAIPVPVTGSDWSRLYGALGKTIAMAGVAAGVGLGMGALGMGLSAMGGFEQDVKGNQWYSPRFDESNSLGKRSFGDVVLTGLGDSITSGADSLYSPHSRAIAATGVSAAVGYNMMSAVPRVQHSGNLSGSVSIMGNRTPFIVLEYPNVNLPEDYKHMYGYPSNRYFTLGSLHGYTECVKVMFESSRATDDEIALIIRALKKGVYL